MYRTFVAVFEILQKWEPLNCHLEGAYIIAWFIYTVSFQMAAQLNLYLHSQNLTILKYSGENQVVKTCKQE